MKRSVREAGHTALMTLVAVIVIAGVGAATWTALRHHHKATAGTAATTATSSSSNAQNLPAGTDNQTLQADVNTINAGNDQDSQNLNSASGALSDQQNEISVPTN